MNTATGRFGAYLKGILDEAGLSNRSIERLTRANHRSLGTEVVTEGRIRQIVKGGDNTTFNTVEALSIALGFPLQEALSVAGVEMPKNRHPKTDPIDGWSLDEMLAAIRARFLSLTQEKEAVPPPLLTVRQEIRARSRTVTHLTALAAKQAADGDPAGAEAMRELAVRLNAQIPDADPVTDSQPPEEH